MNIQNVDFGSARIDLANRSQWNIGYFCAGLIFWIFVAVLGQIYPLDAARIFWLVGTFFIFPIAVISSRLFGADPFTKGNHLADLVGYTHMSVIAMSFPLVLASFLYYPEAMLLVMAIAYCIDFYVMSWAYGSSLFWIHAAVRVVAVSGIWFLLPDWRLPLIPAVIALLYLLTILAIPVMRKRWLRSSAT